jgi:hypothetical protein
MFKFLKKDNYILGGAIGILAPVATWVLLYYANAWVHNSNGVSYFRPFMIQILSLVPNVLLLRYYLIRVKADKTGRGILFVTFIIGIVCFIINL